MRIEQQIPNSDQPPSYTIMANLADHLVIVTALDSALRKMDKRQTKLAEDLLVTFSDYETQEPTARYVRERPFPLLLGQIINDIADDFADRPFDSHEHKVGQDGAKIIVSALGGLATARQGLFSASANDRLKECRIGLGGKTYAQLMGKK